MKYTVKIKNKKENWFLKGKLHRGNDKPASIWADGSKRWYINGNLHREDNKPAIK